MPNANPYAIPTAFFHPAFSVSSQNGSTDVLRFPDFLSCFRLQFLWLRWEGPWEMRDKKPLIFLFVTAMFCTGCMSAGSSEFLLGTALAQKKWRKNDILEDPKKNLGSRQDAKVRVLTVKKSLSREGGLKVVHREREKTCTNPALLTASTRPEERTQRQEWIAMEEKDGA